ncbi:MAG: enoyl-CoA hydratase/isomerase family protein [Gammaproteobacteria bacterium]
MAYQTLNFEIKNHIATITLNRPDAANSLNITMGDELHEVATRCASGSDIRAVILTGAGKMFCAGGDVIGFHGEGDNMENHMRALTTTLHAAISRFHRMDAPLIIAVNGTAAGAGMSISLTGDYVIAADSAKFTMAYTRIGVSPDGSGTYFLPRLVGVRKAKELIFRNPLLSAEDALELGIVNEVVPAEKLMETAEALAAEFAAGPTKAYGETKRLLADTLSNTLETQMELETRAIAGLAGNSEDAKGGIAAFATKGKYEFVGK